MPARYLLVIFVLIQAAPACTKTRTVRMSAGLYQLNPNSLADEGVTARVDLEGMKLEVESLGQRTSVALVKLAREQWSAGCRGGTTLAIEETFDIVPAVTLMHSTYDRVAVSCNLTGLKFWNKAPGGASVLLLTHATEAPTR